MDERRKPLCSEDAMRDALLFALPAAGEFSRSLLVVPLLAGRELIGMFSAQGFETDALGQEGLNVLSAMANQAATAITNARVYEAAQRRAKQLAAVSQVGQRVAAILELDKLFAEVVQLIAETFEYDHVGIFTIDRDSGEVTFRASTDPAIQEHGLDVSKGAGIIGWVAQFGEPVLANDVTKEPRFDFEDLLASTRAELAVPLKVEERIVGVLDVQSNEPDAFGRDDLFVLQTLADQVAIAVEDARLYTDRQEEAWSSTALLQFSQAVSAENNLDEILQTAVRLTPMLLGVSRCSMLLWEEKAQEFVAAKGYTEDPQLRPLFESVHFRPGDLPLLDQLRADHTPLVVAGSSGAVPSQLAQEYRIGNMLALPLCAQGEFHGAMLVDYADPHVRVSTRKQAILAGLADQVAMAIANARLHIAQREEAWVSTALLQVAQTLASSVDLEESISGIARLIPLLVGVDYSLVFIWDGQAEQFIPVASHGFSKAAADSFSAMRLKPDEMPALGDVMQRRAHVVVEDAAGDGAMPDSVVRTLGVQAYAAAPLTSKREVLGVLVAGYQEKGQRFSDRNISILEGVAYQTAVAIDNARLYEATLEQERTAQELRLAREIQVSFLPERCPSLRGWEICADWRAAREVGGDFYDFIPLDSEHLGLVIADVSDKGMPAALFMSLCRTLLRVSAGETLSPAEALQRANELLVAESRSGMFVTVFYGILNWRQGRLAYANAGHNSPILWRQAQPQVVALAAGGIVLGVLGDIELEERDISIEPGDILLLYTDGVTEPINAQEDEFGGERLVEAIAQNSERPCAEIVQAIHDAVSGFVGDQPQFDDYTLVALKRQA
jgi:serine phosphatase RsbU (regulator of sigma subunit)/putative methionine-R-sulfoxide reductase with GAF domain